MATITAAARSSESTPTRAPGGWSATRVSPSPRADTSTGGSTTSTGFLTP